MPRKRKQTQNDKVLKFMQTNDGITVWEAVYYLSILSLPRRIKDLKEQGYNITMTWQKTPDGERFGLYKLMED